VGPSLACERASAIAKVRFITFSFANLYRKGWIKLKDLRLGS